MTNPLKQVAAAVGQVGQKVSGMKSFFMFTLKAAATALSVLIASRFLVPLIRAIPGLSRFARGGAIIAGLVLATVAGFLAMLRFGVTKFLAVGLGIAGMLTMLTVVLATPLSKASDALNNLISKGVKA